jgi:hypothetical protein
MSRDPDDTVAAITGREALDISRNVVRDVKLANPEVEFDHLDVIVFNAVTLAYELGRTHARAENDLVNELTHDVIEARHAYAVQASIAAIMQAAHVPEITLQLADIEKIFTTHELRLVSLDVTSSLTYRLVEREPT